MMQRKIGKIWVRITIWIQEFHLCLSDLGVWTEFITKLNQFNLTSNVYKVSKAYRAVELAVDSKTSFLRLQLMIEEISYIYYFYVYEVKYTGCMSLISWKSRDGDGWGSAAITMTSSWVRWRLKLSASRWFNQSFDQAQINEIIKAPRHWLLCG